MRRIEVLHSHESIAKSSTGVLSRPGCFDRRSGSVRLWGLSSKRFVTVGIGAAFIIGALLRCPFIGDQSLWYDEVYTHNAVAQPSLSGVIAKVTATESTPPLFYVLTWLVVKTIGSSSDLAIRLIPLTAGVLVVPVVFLALRRFIGRGPALVATWMCAVSPLMVWYSIEARTYSLLILLCLLSLWSVGRILDSPTPKRFAIWALFGVLCIYSHYFSIFLLVAEFVVVFCVLGRQKSIAVTRPRWVSQLLGCGLVMGVSALPLVPMLVAQNDSRTGYMSQLAWGFRLSVFAKQFSLGGPFNVPFNPYMGLVALLLSGFGVLLGCLVILGRYPRFESRLPRWLRWLQSPILPFTVPKGARRLVAICLIALVIPALLTVVAIDPHFYFRNLLFLWPLLAGVAAIGLLRFRAIVLCAYFAVLLCGTGLILFDWRYQRPDWAEAARVVGPLAGRAPIIASTNLGGDPAAYYLHRRQGLRDEITVDSVWIVLNTRQKRPLSQLDPDFYRRPAGFSLSRSLRTSRGFWLLNFTAPHPTRIKLSDLAGLEQERFPRLILPQS